MCVVLAITNNTNSKMDLIECDSEDDALCKMKAFYVNLSTASQVDYYNTYFDSETKYAQIVNGFEQIELRIGVLRGLPK